MLFHGGDGAFHRANPLTRLALLAAVAAMLPLWPAPVLLAALLACLAAGFALGFGRVLLWRWLLLMAPVALALALVHGLLIRRGPEVAWGPLLLYPEGLSHALLIFARLGLLLAAGLVFVMTTRPGDLARALDGAGLPPSLSYLLTAPLALVDAVADESRMVRDSLQLRGFAPQGGLRDRIRVLSAMTTPLVRNLIFEAPARAEILEMRGFRALPRRSLLHPAPDSRAERRLRRLLLGLAGLQLALLLA